MSILPTCIGRINKNLTSRFQTMKVVLNVDRYLHIKSLTIIYLSDPNHKKFIKSFYHKHGHNHKGVINTIHKTSSKTIPILIMFTDRQPKTFSKPIAHYQPSSLQPPATNKVAIKIRNLPLPTLFIWNLWCSDQALVFSAQISWTRYYGQYYLNTYYCNNGCKNNI